MASDRWSSAVEVDDARGTVIYTYAGQTQSSEEILNQTGRMLRAASREEKVKALPIFLILLHDEDGLLGQSMAECAVLDDISDEDRARFGNLIPAHREKLLRVIREKIDSCIKKRLYSTALQENFENQRLSQVGTALFEQIYTNPISFPFDGFSTARGNAAEDCQEFTRELLHGKLDYEGVIAKPIRAQNRAISVLANTWGIFNRNGSVSRRPNHPDIRSITVKWDDTLSQEQRLSVTKAIQQICRPPYGANIASAGLLLGVYVAPRHEKLIANKDGLQLSVSQLIQDGIFRGRFINLALLHGVDLMSIGMPPLNGRLYLMNGNNARIICRD